MVNQQLIHWLAKEEELVVPTLFKPVQFNIIKKLDKGERLTENEQRYLRGKMKEKIRILQEIPKIIQDEYTILLNTIDSYYITGLEALKYNGYGWYYEPKIIEVINTKIEGKITAKDKKIKFIRVKSITNSKITMDREKHLKYATNEQVIKDISFTKNKYTKKVWINMYKRYKKMFAKPINEVKENNCKQYSYSRYGVLE